MRADLRQSCSRIWIIDCSPEGHQPPTANRIFQGVQQPICIVIAAKKASKDASEPAQVEFRALAEARREEKFAELNHINLTTSGWVICPNGWREPFLPSGAGPWVSFPYLSAFFEYNGSGVMPGRTWVVAPDRLTLSRRWKRLVEEKDPLQKEKLFHAQTRKGKVASRHIRKTVNQPLGKRPTRPTTIIEDNGEAEPAVRYGFRTFDPQWLTGDARLLNDVRPILWNSVSDRQVFLTALEASAPTHGPAISFTGYVPDQHHFKGSFGGRAYLLWRDQAASKSNVRLAMLEVLAEAFGRSVAPEEVMAYCAATMAHPAFTASFKGDLIRPGLRVPLSADAALFEEAAALGREVIWLHCYGERFHDAAAGRPKAPPRLPPDSAPTIPADGAIPPAPEPLPDVMTYDATTRRLTIGRGHVDNVAPEVWAYEVSGKNVLRQWFSYRRRDRTRPVMGDRRPPSPLDAIQPDGWLAEYTTDLMNLLHVLGRLVLLEPRQADLLKRVLDHPLITVADLEPAVEDVCDSQTADGAA